MSANTVTARQGDTISSIAYRVGGNSRSMVEPILALNAGLCRLPVLLPMGTVIKMPAPKKQAAPVLPAVNLWD